MKLLLIFIGGGCGSVLRYIISMGSKAMLCSLGSNAALAGTFCCNILGCVLIGMFNGYSARFGWSQELRLMLTVGLCGGFTTFSTFSAEGLSLLQSGYYLSYTVYALLSIIIGLAAVLLGCWISQ